MRISSESFSGVYLAAAGLDVVEEVKKGALVLSSVQDHLTNGRFDPERMLAMLKDAMDEALNDGYTSLWATGDMMWELGSEQNLDRLLEYECGLEELLQKHPALGGICQYRRQSLPASAIQAALYTHQAIFINDTLSKVNPFYQHPATARLRDIGASSGHLQEMLDHLQLPLKR